MWSSQYTQTAYHIVCQKVNCLRSSQALTLAVKIHGSTGWAIPHWLSVCIRCARDCLLENRVSASFVYAWCRLWSPKWASPAYEVRWVHTMHSLNAITLFLNTEICRLTCAWQLPEQEHTLYSPTYDNSHIIMFQKRSTIYEILGRIVVRISNDTQDP